MLKIIPALLTQNSSDLTAQLANLESFFDRVQIDILDGQFTQNQTIFPEVLSQIDTNLALDFHLMVKDPISWIDRCISGFADRIIGQIEIMGSQMQFVEKIEQQGLSVGLALDLATPPDKLDLNVLPLLDSLLLMSVPAGFGGQTLDPSIFEKIAQAQDLRLKTNSNFTICIDGGVSSTNIARLAQAGVDEVAIGHRLTTGNIPANLEEIQQTLQ